MIAFFANIFGYVLNFIYNIVGNYGYAIILFCIIIKLLMLPMSIKQQKTMKKNGKIQKKTQEIQFKYKDNPEKLNQELLNLYKEEKMSPCSGCFGAIIQIVLLLSVFYLVRQPLTYMKKVDSELIDKYSKLVETQDGKEDIYKEIKILREIRTLDFENKVEQNENPEETNNEELPTEGENTENVEEQVSTENEKIEVNKEEVEKLMINMEFLGLDLSQIPLQNSSDWKVFIIPALYVILSFVSMQLVNKMPGQGNKKDEQSAQSEELDAINQANKTMSYMFPIMYISVALVAPLGLALYWAVNSILMIVEKLALNKIINNEKEEEK